VLGAVSDNWRGVQVAINRLLLIPGADCEVRECVWGGGDWGVVLLHGAVCCFTTNRNCAAYTGSAASHHVHGLGRSIMGLDCEYTQPADAKATAEHAPFPFRPPPSQCGCQCTKCCYQGNTNNCTAISSGTCPYDCLARNKTNCGVQFSTPRQSIFCAIPHTSAWPAILQVRGLRVTLGKKRCVLRIVC
jgi:hypothetical protein